MKKVLLVSLVVCIMGFVYFELFDRTPDKLEFTNVILEGVDKEDFGVWMGGNMGSTDGAMIFKTKVEKNGDSGTFMYRYRITNTYDNQIAIRSLVFAMISTKVEPDLDDWIELNSGEIKEFSFIDTNPNAHPVVVSEYVEYVALSGRMPEFLKKSSTRATGMSLPAFVPSSYVDSRD